MPRVFVNGDSHTAQVYGSPAPTATEILARRYHCQYENIALPGGSNQRIIRTTLERLPDLDPADTVIIIGWSSFERTEWFFQGQWHQICGDSNYAVDPQLQELWHQHIDSWWCDDNHECWRRQADQHHAIWTFHRLLHSLGYEFLFYQGCRTFFFDGCPQQDMAFQLPWKANTWVHDPYVRLESNGERCAESFSHFAQARACLHQDSGAHFGADAHAAWADHLDAAFVSKLQSLKERHL